jgi:hypothetical protein
MNYFLQKVTSEDSKLEKEAADRLIGEVYCLRAWAYYNLIQRYAGVPIIKVPHRLDSEDFTVDRSNFDDCVDFILDDLDKAEALLPTKTASKRGKLNKDVVLAIRARVTLLAASKLFNDPLSPEPSIFKGKYDYEGKWERAFNACKAVVDRADVDGAYELDDKYSDFWKDVDSKELIWAKYFVVTEDIDKAQLYYSMSGLTNGWASMQPTQAMLIDYEMNNGKKFFEEGSGYNPKKPFANRDPRFYESIGTPFSKYGVTEDGSYTEKELQLYFLFKNKTMADFEKGKSLPTHDATSQEMTDETAPLFTGLGCNKWYDPLKPVTDKQTISPFYPWFRLGEFYLNYAEAAYMYGKEDICREYINKVRARVGMPPVSESGESLWDRLVNERRIELAFEFTRYFDVRRWMVADFYENIPIAGMQTMILENGVKRDTVYRMARLSSEIDKNTCYYWPNSSERETYITNNYGRDIQTVWTYRWLGKDYEIDYGECRVTISPTQKIFYPEKNYLMPIPETEIKKSQNKIQQNPGY